MHIFLENKSTLHYQKARAARKKISMTRGYQSLKGGGDKTYLPWGEWSPWGDKVTMDRGPPISPLTVENPVILTKLADSSI